jgi:hypothetical protein
MYTGLRNALLLQPWDYLRCTLPRQLLVPFTGWVLRRHTVRKGHGVGYIAVGKVLGALGPDAKSRREGFSCSEGSLAGSTAVARLYALEALEYD